MEWNTGLDYWTELFSHFGQVSVYGSLHFIKFTSIWLLQVIVIMAIDKFKCMFENTAAIIL